MPTSEVDLVTDRVWEPGEGARIREQDEEEARNEMHPCGRALRTVFSRD